MLGSKGIQRELLKGNIVIHPFNQEQINPNSYDVRLGNWFIQSRTHNAPVSLESIFSTGLIWGEPFYYKDNSLFVLEPDAYVLAHTEEYIGSYKHATLLKARSTFARLFIDICPSAGFGDVGYTNRWTLEIKNNSNNHYILKPGMRVAQISFQEVKEKGILYAGAYKQNDILTSWKPEDMLPRLGKDRVF